MNILVVSDVLTDEVNNGTDIATVNLINYLKGRGDTVKVLCANESKKDDPDYFVVPTLNLYMLNNYVKKNNVILATANKKIIDEALDFADHVHIMIALHLGIKVAQRAYERGLPVTAGFHMQAQNFSSHVFMQNNDRFNRAVYKYIYKHMFKYCDAIHYPTKFIQDIFEKNIKAKTNGYVISNGINDYVLKYEVDKAKDFEDKIVILSTGRYSKEKDQITLLKAVNYSKHKADILVVLAGQGPIDKKYKKYAKRHKINHIFKFFGRKEIVDMINMADLYVHPALMELEGIAALEAMCCGKCAIVSDSELAAPKLFAADPSCIFKHHNPKDLAVKIDYFIENKEEKKRIEDIYYNNRVTYDLDKCMEKMGEMIDEVYKNHKR